MRRGVRVVIGIADFGGREEGVKVEGRELFEGGEAEMLEEGGRGAVENGATGAFSAANFFDEAFGEERFDDGVGVDAAQALEARAGDGLLVGDDGEGFNRRAAEALEGFEAKKFFDGFGGLRRGGELDAVFVALEAEAALGCRVKAFQFFEGGFEGARGGVEGLRKLRNWHRAIGDEEEAFEERRERQSGRVIIGGQGFFSMKFKGFFVYIVLAAMLTAALACGGPLPVGGPTPAYDPIPISTEAVGSLNDKFNSLGVASGEVTVTITESELTSYLDQQLEAQPDSAFSNPQVYLRDGKLKLYAVVTTEQLTGNVEIVMNAVIKENQLVVEIESANFGPAPAPQSLLDSLTATINDQLFGPVSNLPTGVGIKSIVVADGQMTLTAIVK